MKKLTAIFLVLFFALLNFSCITIDPKKLYPDMVADQDPVSVGFIEAEFDRLLSARLNKVEMEVVFYPRYNEVALNFRHQLTSYRQFWSQKGRDLFIKAVESYKADYASKNLGNKFSKTRRAYGKFKGKLEWSYSKYSDWSNSSPSIELGYRFRGEKGKETPFFAVSQSSAQEESSLRDGGNKLDSIPIYMYFTREQADELARVLNQESLLSALVLSPDYDQPKDDDYGEAVF
ncbi:MAG: hypothetical protein LBS57_04490 [Treponema sp.]|nr:hypothetical protein [Treponema sp.]